MKPCALLTAGLAALGGWASAQDALDAGCREKLTRQVAALESGLTANRAYFDREMDLILTKYAAEHPAASKDDYKGVFDEMYQRRLARLAEPQHGLVRQYRAVLDGDPQVDGVCELPERAMSKATGKSLEQNRVLYEDILRQMSTMLSVP